MKKIYSLLLVSLAFNPFSVLMAQDFTFSPSNSLTKNVPLESYSDLEIKMYNQLNQPLALSWEVLSNTFSKDWDFSICDYGNCYISVPVGTTKKMNNIPVGEYGFFKVSINPNNFSGTGILKILVYNTDNQSFSDTVTFTANTISTGVNSLTGNSVFSLSPNPANNYIHLKITDNSLTINPVGVFNIIGELVKEVEVRSGSTTRIDTGNFPSGVYFVKYQDEHKNILTKKFYVTH